MNLDKNTTTLLLVVALIVVLSTKRSHGHDADLHLVSDTQGNESLVVVASVPPLSKSMLFMLDTAYAGAPVLSTSYLSLLQKEFLLPSSVQNRYRHSVDQIRASVEPDDRHRSVQDFVRHTGCRSFTSGCTMRLMGIGSINEARSDLLLCNGLSIRGERERPAAAPVSTTICAGTSPTVMDTRNAPPTK